MEKQQQQQPTIEQIEAQYESDSGRIAKLIARKDEAIIGLLRQIEHLNKTLQSLQVDNERLGGEIESLKKKQNPTIESEFAEAAKA